MAAPKTDRSRSDRSAATRTALLDATIELLAERGYAGTTARGVAQRAGVSQGAMQHHFRTRGDLIQAACDRLIERTAGQMQDVVAAGATERERAEILLDRLWANLNTPIAPAVFELYHAARSETEVAERITATFRTTNGLLFEAVRALMPTLTQLPEFIEWLLLANATIRGITLVGQVPGAEGSTVSWEAARRHLLRDLDAILRDAGAEQR